MNPQQSLRRLKAEMEKMENKKNENWETDGR